MDVMIVQIKVNYITNTHKKMMKNIIKKIRYHISFSINMLKRDMSIILQKVPIIVRMIDYSNCPRSWDLFLENSN